LVGDEVIQGMAALLVKLVKLTPHGMERLRDTDPVAALELLAEGDHLVQPLIQHDREQREYAPWEQTKYEEIPIEELRRMLDDAKEHPAEGET
jgi:hypothetical protein